MIHSLLAMLNELAFNTQLPDRMAAAQDHMRSSGLDAGKIILLLVIALVVIGIIVHGVISSKKK